MNKKHSVPSYTKQEEIWNSATHGLGAVMGLIGTIVLVISAYIHSDWTSVISVLIYGATMILLYTMSTIYHAVTNERSKRIMQICDHCSIFLLIAGTYTPFMMIALKSTLGYMICGVVWLVAIIGITLNIIDLKKYEKISMICYVAMGWAIVIALKPLIASITGPSLVLLILGGLFYTIGLIFYGMKKYRYMHSIWHLFVLGGSITHYASILLYILKL